MTNNEGKILNMKQRSIEVICKRYDVLRGYLSDILNHSLQYRL